MEATMGVEEEDAPPATGAVGTEEALTMTPAGMGAAAAEATTGIEEEAMATLQAPATITANSATPKVCSQQAKKNEGD
nr:unnamed protein product [Digitaria exilis]